MMAALGHLEEFDVSRPVSWNDYASRVQFYLEANAIIDPARQKAVFLSVCGTRTFKIIRSLVSPATPEVPSLQDILTLLKSHFSPRPSEIYRRFCFHRRNQHADEGIAAYTSELRNLAQYCNFGDQLDATLRDCLVCGLRDEGLQRRLLAESTLTLAQTMERALAAEAASLHISEIRGLNDANMSSVHAKENFKNPRRVIQNPKGQKEVSLRCHSCDGPHLRVSCRFREAECHTCHKMGHIAKVCRAKKMDSQLDKIFQRSTRTKAHFLPTAEGSSSEKDNDFVDVYNMNLIQSSQELCGLKSPVTTVVINGLAVQMEIDSGARVAIVGSRIYHQLFPERRPELVKSPIVLSDYNKRPVQVLGMVEVDVCYGKKKAKLPLLIAAEDHHSLLGHNWFQALGLSIAGIKNVSAKELVESEDAVVRELLKIPDEFPAVFEEGLGTF